jgi:5-methyltetrahydrofolate--homocysteine methyltransferase
MTLTKLCSASKEVTIGFDQPFCVIGERINPTGRKLLAKEMTQGDFSRVEADAVAQVEAGATMLDVNAGIPLADEPGILSTAIKTIQAITDVPLSIDSSIVAALKAGLDTYEGKALVNSVTGEEDRLEAVLPLIKKYVAKKIVERAQDFGIKANDVVVDPLIMPVGAINRAGITAFQLIRRLREELGVNTTCGASNISFGLPNRHNLNASFLSMGIGAGMTSAIMNPLHLEEMTAIYGANIMMGHDPECRNWIRRFREPSRTLGVEENQHRRSRRRKRA